MTIKLTEEQKIKLLNSEDIYKLMQEILLREEKIDQEKEHFWMIGLALNNRLQYIELVSLGSVKATTVEPMNVFRWAVMKGSVKVVMVHNHPSGELIPSKADEDLTDRLIQVGRILNIETIDHLIISAKSYFSFEGTGLMAALRMSTRWVPQFEIIERIRKEEKKIRQEAIKNEKEKAKKEKEIALKKKEIEKEEEKRIALIKEKQSIAKAMKNKNIPIETIAETTGLSKKEIEKL